MSEALEIDPKLDLAIWVARGKAVCAWAAEKKVPNRTTFRWSEEPKFRAEVARIRRRHVDRLVGLMSASLPKQ